MGENRIVFRGEDSGDNEADIGLFMRREGRTLRVGVETVNVVARGLNTDCSVVARVISGVI